MGLDMIIGGHVSEWVIKTATDPNPRRVNMDDIAFIRRLLEKAAHEAPDVAPAFLMEELGGWLVQRERGQQPSFLGLEDMSTLLALVTATEVEAPMAVSEVCEGGKLEKAEKTGAVSGEALALDKDPALRYAVFHLDYGV